MVSVREIREGFIRIVDETPAVSDETYLRLYRYALLPDDIVFARKGSVDRSALIPNTGNKYFLGSDGIRIRVDKEKIDPHLMLYIFQSSEAKRFLMQSAYGTTMAGLNERIICSLEFTIPERVEEQQSIAKALADIDAHIQKTEQIVAKKKAIKQGAMQELLTGKKRLPGFADKWIMRTIGDIACIESGGTPSTTVGSYWNGKISWCTPTDITENRSKYIGNTEKTITKEGVLNSSAKLLPKGTILLCTRATIGESSIATDVITTNQGFKNLVCNDDVYNEFLYYALQLKKTEMVSLAIGSTFLEISKNALSGILIDLPDNKDEQVAIAGVLSDIDEEIELLEQKLAKHRQLKQGMMQQLLTGKTRLI